MSERLKVGVVGVGHVGRHHARILAERSDVELVAVADIDADRAGTVASETGAGAETDAHALLGRVDAVTVAVPTEAHDTVALPFLDAGVPVLVEKPIAATVPRATTMVEAARRSGATLGVGHSERYNPAIATALPLVRNPRFVEIHRLASFPARSLDVDVVFDVMIHDLDVVLAFVKGAPQLVEAVGVPVLSDRVDIANARLRFDNGCIRQSDGESDQSGSRQEAALLPAERPRLGRLRGAGGRGVAGDAPTRSRPGDHRGSGSGSARGAAGARARGFRQVGA